jgi:hypothetical protein
VDVGRRSFPPAGAALARARDSLAPSELAPLVHAAESLDDDDAMTLATTCVERLGQSL